MDEYRRGEFERWLFASLKDILLFASSLLIYCCEAIGTTEPEIVSFFFLLNI
jgi:hypothetical protein